MTSTQNTVTPAGYVKCPKGKDVQTFPAYVSWRRRISRNSADEIRKCRNHFNERILTPEQREILKHS